MSGRRRCQRYTSNGTACQRAASQGSDWCGVCAGLRSPNSAELGRSDQVAANLASYATQELGFAPDPNLQRWADTVHEPRRWGTLEDSELVAALEARPDATVASEAELRGLLDPAGPAVERVHADLHAAVMAWEHARSGADDPAWSERLAVLAEQASVDALYPEVLVDDEIDQRTLGQVAARVSFHEAVADGSVANPDAFDRWMDVQIADAGLSDDAGRERTVGFRAELVDLAERAYGQRSVRLGG